MFVKFFEWKGNLTNSTIWNTKETGDIDGPLIKLWMLMLHNFEAIYQYFGERSQKVRKFAKSKIGAQK